MIQQTGRVALVTGANKGIGFEICRGIASRGVTVVMGARDIQRGETAFSRLQAEGLAVKFLLLDVADSHSIKAAVNEIAKFYDRLDVLVNNAGIMLDEEATGLEVGHRTVRETLRTNFYGPLLLCQNCIPLMRKNGYGRIVNISSTLGSLAEMADPESGYAAVQSPAYRLSKNALNGITALFASQVRGENILVNSACPGWVKTDMGGPRALLSPEQGADTPIWLATLPDNGPTGGFFRERKLIAW
jgi:NAD(P)-dependent dehydrogenase (short-subunit alcohol dehydrogenase family)